MAVEPMVGRNNVKKALLCVFEHLLLLLRSRPQHKRLFFQAKLRHTGKCASTVTLSCSRNGQKSFGSLKNTLFVHRDSINIYPCPQFTVLWSKGLLRRHLILNLRVRKEHHIVRIGNHVSICLSSPDTSKQMLLQVLHPANLSLSSCHQPSKQQAILEKIQSKTKTTANNDSPSNTASEKTI
ncbi:uncharacterized protein LOC131834808 [Mustela lutreola]|uniref:uncharacterized protein LOC131834808 n=1 Tax=Mustela lutreola TaxID=9666 RepID=UPI002797C21D|nr:uncharacterized protein LOC131834808 [Mustela lutreola]